ncbi:MAG: bis(5'-nucleosyl)-tetraphosphatase (symmetrical) YqeK [Peptococcaceae bacterium]|nr:bis(5'-nucleosyl)-tetraphosphatase (symmetrical) YqeK [Peptococcaceae bacterium]
MIEIKKIIEGQEGKAGGAVAEAVCLTAGGAAAERWQTQRIRMAGMLKPKRFIHSLAVADTAVRMSVWLGGDPVKLAIAGLLHDGAKNLSNERLLALAREHNLLTDPAELIRPDLLHGPVAAWLAEHQWGETDPQILQAIRLHTTAGPEMCLVAGIIFMADLIEPNRSYPGVEELRQSCRKGLKEAVILAIDDTFDYLERENQPVHQGMVRCRQWLTEGKGEFCE